MTAFDIQQLFKVSHLTPLAAKSRYCEIVGLILTVSNIQ